MGGYQMNTDEKRKDLVKLMAVKGVKEDRHGGDDRGGVGEIWPLIVRRRENQNCFCFHLGM